MSISSASKLRRKKKKKGRSNRSTSKHGSEVDMSDFGDNDKSI